jgi:hypothetical protein
MSSAAARAALASVSDTVTISDDFFLHNTPTVKSYNNPSFLNSNSARSLRIMCEYQEPMDRLLSHLGGELHTVLFFASARGKCRADHDRAVVDAQAALDALPADAPACDREKAEAWIVRLGRLEWQCAFYEKVRALSRAVAQWGVSRMEDDRPRVSICTGGGPGLMAAANQGAREVAGAKSIGMAISLPFEKGCNPYVDEELAFEFHYFFTRKFHMCFAAKALIVAPGGFGTCDELFELITLVQTGKESPIPIVLFGKEYWQSVINWEKFVEYGTVSPRDVARLFFTDSVEEALEHISVGINAREDMRAAKK